MSSPRTLLGCHCRFRSVAFQGVGGRSPPDSFGDPLPPYATAQAWHGAAEARSTGRQLSRFRRTGNPCSPSVGAKRLSPRFASGTPPTARKNGAFVNALPPAPHSRPDGRSVAVGGGIGVVRLWQAETGRELRMLTGDPGAVSAVALHAGRQASVHRRRVGQVSSVRCGQRRRNPRLHRPRRRQVLGLALSADGKTLASSGADGTLRLWEVENGKESLKIALPAANGRSWRCRPTAKLCSPPAKTAKCGAGRPPGRSWRR